MDFELTAATPNGGSSASHSVRLELIVGQSSQSGQLADSQSGCRRQQHDALAQHSAAKRPSPQSRGLNYDHHDNSHHLASPLFPFHIAICSLLARRPSGRATETTPLRSQPGAAFTCCPGFAQAHPTPRQSVPDSQHTAALTCYLSTATVRIRDIPPSDSPIDDTPPTT